MAGLRSGDGVIFFHCTAKQGTLAKRIDTLERFHNKILVSQAAMRLITERGGHA